MNGIERERSRVDEWRDKECPEMGKTRKKRTMPENGVHEDKGK